MSARRVVVSCAVMALVVAAGSWFAVDAFPLMQQAAPGQAAFPASPGAGPLERRAQPVTPENPVPRRTHSVAALYPPEAAGTGAGATVMLRITLDESGRVAEARQNPARVMFTMARGGGAGAAMVWGASDSTSGQLSAGTVSSATPGGRRGTAGVRIGGVPTPPPPPANDALEPFVKSAITAVRQWQYDPPASGPLAFDITLAFRPDADAVLIAQNTLFNVTGQTAAFDAGFVPIPPPPPPPPDRSPGSRSLRTEETLRGDGARPGPGTAAAASPAFVPVPPPPPPPPAPPGQSSPQASLQSWGAVRVGGTLPLPVKTRSVAPVYPAVALAARVQGVVILEAVIDTDGRVADARVLRSIPLLDQAALDAVRQWEFQPTLLNGQPVPVIMTTTVQFTVPQP